VYVLVGGIKSAKPPWKRRSTRTQVLEAFACFWVAVDSFKGKKVRVVGATAITMHILGRIILV
jgi:hypothetical protein